ncbi:hypothetical protein SAY86_027644 [Trapa natans]|uniref:TPX2 C-terminal domain-containing protein n=1 Tax=Trapa natans TaxID=22666 RepID=A0AAN7KM28_TRANT|nr:hypothetical protein SAY86_027644 [Trapa natans]
MNAGTVIPENGYEVLHQNGVHDQLLLSGAHESILNISDKASDIALLNGNLEGFLGFVVDLLIQEVGEFKRATSKSYKHLERESNKRDEKRLHAKVTATIASKKTGDVKDLEAVPSRFNPDLPSKSRSFNDHLSQSTVSKKQQGGKSSAASPEVLGEKIKIKSLKTGTPSKPKEDTQPYDFYTKLEEKIHAKKIEKTNQQAKSKKTHETEIKLLRKSLKFKCTPLPNFYQGPPPPKPELKKKTANEEESEENSGHNQRLDRLSLDAVSCNNTNTEPSPNPKKPPRKSRPKLPLRGNHC